MNQVVFDTETNKLSINGMEIEHTVSASVNLVPDPRNCFIEIRFEGQFSVLNLDGLKIAPDATGAIRLRWCYVKKKYKLKATNFLSLTGNFTYSFF